MSILAYTLFLPVYMKNVRKCRILKVILLVDFCCIIRHYEEVFVWDDIFSEGLATCY